jgi:hypothetical protein
MGRLVCLVGEGLFWDMAGIFGGTLALRLRVAVDEVVFAFGVRVATGGFAGRWNALTGVSSSDPTLLLNPIADGGLDITIGLCCEKKLDLRLVFAGEAGTFAIDSIVRSARDKRGFLGSDAITVLASGDSSSPTRVSTLDDALEPDLKAFCSLVVVSLESLLAARTLDVLYTGAFRVIFRLAVAVAAKVAEETLGRSC